MAAQRDVRHPDERGVAPYVRVASDVAGVVVERALVYLVSDDERAGEAVLAVVARIALREQLQKRLYHARAILGRRVGRVERGAAGVLRPQRGESVGPVRARTEQYVKIDVYARVRARLDAAVERVDLGAVKEYDYAADLD